MSTTSMPAFRLCLAMTLACACGLASAAGKAHQHGNMKLDVAIDGKQVTVLLETPLDSLLGFEHTPRTDGQRQAAAELLSRMRNAVTGQRLFSLNGEANCALTKAEVNAPVLEPSASAAEKTAHADLDACYRFDCEKPEQLRELQVGLFDVFKRIRQIDVQVAGAKGQSKTALNRTSRIVKLAK